MRQKTGAIGEILENLGQTGVKSIQKIIYTNPGSEEGTDAMKILIAPVNPAHCIVLVERAINRETSLMTYSYTLSADKISVSHAGWSQAGVFSLIFTVIELYSVGGE